MKKRIYDYVDWIGACFYPKIEDFIDEAEKQGIRRRIAFYPKKLIPDYSICYLAHQQLEQIKKCKSCGNMLQKYKRKCNKCGSKDIEIKTIKIPVIFGFYVVGGIEIIVEEKNKNFNISSNIRQIALKELKNEEKRGCGFRNSINAMYLYNSENKEILEKFVDNNKEYIYMKNNIIIFKDYVYSNMNFFRGLKLFDAENHIPTIKIKRPEDMTIWKALNMKNIEEYINV